MLFLSSFDNDSESRVQKTLRGESEPRKLHICIFVFQGILSDCSSVLPKQKRALEYKQTHIKIKYFECNNVTYLNLKKIDNSVLVFIP